MLDSILTLAASSELTPARSQMAFTLGFHIVLACLGVAFPAIMLIANYRGLRHDDPDAMLLAQRWSKVTAVTFAVGAVTGTVLSFEFGLLWPEFTGRFGEVFGVAFAIEGIFFFLEAIFIAIYIYGWKRLSGWAHFWTGVPIVIAGIGGAFSVVAVNSWMNQPDGFNIAAAGAVTDVDPLDAIFNAAVPYEVPHMILAAYLVTGFLVASVYAVGMLRGRRDRYHRLGLLIPLTVASIAAPIQFAVGDFAARAIADDQPIKFAALECVQETTPRRHRVHRRNLHRRRGQVGDRDPRPRLVPGRLQHRHRGDRPRFRAARRAPAREHAAAPRLRRHGRDRLRADRARRLVRVRLVATPRHPAPPWFLRAVAVSGVAAIVALECGWIVTEVGRQPWVVYGVMRTEEAVTGASGIWITFAARSSSTRCSGSPPCSCCERWRGAGASRVTDAVDVPYGPHPSPPAPAGRSG